MRIRRIITTNDIGIQSGAKTNHQDQVITLHNLSTINATVRRVQNEVPPPIYLVLDSSAIY